MKLHCVPCEGGATALSSENVRELVQQIDAQWKVEEERSIRREWKFKNFKDALAFANKVGEIAEAERHHPDLEIGWGRVKVSLRTHAANGLTENDFILARAIDQIPKM
ncbi:4a-hydroxytetrahydrobiopterin dehydratase [Candidatus Uhrbacteria bacterium]|nr:4a-hydroxytetrahydrobiopterin dehydratase [Candidatus Uhrbacteria bacterium]